MRTSKPTWMLLISFVALAVYGQGPAAAAGTGERTTPQSKPRFLPVLAKAGIEQTTAVARRWKSDAALLQIVGRNVSDEGLALFWQYGFYSKTAQACVVVTGGTLEQQEAGGKECAAATLGEFLDSDKVIKIARQSGVAHKSVSMIISVPTKEPVWVVMDERGMKPGNVMLDVDGRTGKVLGKRTQK